MSPGILPILRPVKSNTEISRFRGTSLTVSPEERVVRVSRGPRLINDTTLVLPDCLTKQSVLMVSAIVFARGLVFALISFWRFFGQWH